MREPDTSHDPLSTALRELDSRRASPGFTSKVLERIDEVGAHRRRPHPRRLLLGATGALAALLVAALLFSLSGERARSRASSERAEQLRLEHDQLRSELETLRRARAADRPLLYLGSNAEYDLVLDLDPLLAQPAGIPRVPDLQDLKLERPGVREAARRQP